MVFLEMVKHDGHLMVKSLMEMANMKMKSDKKKKKKKKKEPK